MFAVLAKLSLFSVLALSFLEIYFQSSSTFRENDLNSITPSTFALINTQNNISSHLLITIDNQRQSYISSVNSMLLNHPVRSNIISDKPLSEVISFIFNDLKCKNKPVFISLASVASDTYWQMIENFIYSMVKFEIVSCTLMICVSDNHCMQLCAQSGFPCYDFQYTEHHKNSEVPSVMEQIAELKLFHIPQALENNVDVFLIDLDVGFLESPMQIVNSLYNSSNDIYVQEDLSFVMHRSREKWRTWYTVPLPNIGLFLCRGNQRTVQMFHAAWSDYKAITKPIKHNPGKDQNKVVNAMMSSTVRWSYISKDSAVLLDKIYKFQEQSHELGGEAAINMLQRKGAMAAHTTCYEQKTKVMGLKAANAFWNPYYYDPNRRTITKKLLYINPSQLLRELKSLIYFAIITNRTLIIPNILGDEANAMITLYNERLLWPGFRVAYFKTQIKFKVKIVEPAFYWRIKRERNYLQTNIPESVIVSFPESQSFATLENDLLSSNYRNYPRIVLNAQSSHTDMKHSRSLSLQEWAGDSVGIFGLFQSERLEYGSIPSIPKQGRLGNRELAYDITQGVRLCKGMFERMRGNRSCFDKCK